MSSPDQSRPAAAHVASEEHTGSDLHDLLRRSFRPRTAEAADAVQSAVETLLAHARRSTVVVREDVAQTIEQMIAELDRKIHITEHAMQEKRFEQNPAFERFVNVACGEFAWLDYLAYSAMHPVLGYERALNAFVERVTSLADATAQRAAAAAAAAGDGDGDGDGDDDGDDHDHDAGRHARACRRAFPGLYCAPRRSLADLQRMLARYFDVPLLIAPRHGRWMPVRPAPRGARRIGAWRLGARVWDVQHAMEIVVGPIDADAFHRWQRRAATVMTVCAVVEDFVDGRIDAVVKVEVRTRPELNGRVGRMRLGVDAWCRPGHALRTLTVHEACVSGTGIGNGALACV